jgi:hypothetical protein
MSRDEVDGREMEEDEDEDGGNVVWRSRLRDRENIVDGGCSGAAQRST